MTDYLERPGDGLASPFVNPVKVSQRSTIHHRADS
jgi:hypothetical protein